MAPINNSAKALQQNRPRPAVPKAIVPAIPLTYVQKRQKQQAARAKIEREEAPPASPIVAESPAPTSPISETVVVNGSSTLEKDEPAQAQQTEEKESEAETEAEPEPELEAEAQQELDTSVESAGSVGAEEVVESTETPAVEEEPSGMQTESYPPWFLKSMKLTTPQQMHRKPHDLLPLKLCHLPPDLRTNYHRRLFPRRIRSSLTWAPRHIIFLIRLPSMVLTIQCIMRTRVLEV
jgi:hypothetical protein